MPGCFKLLYYLYVLPVVQSSAVVNVHCIHPSFLLEIHNGWQDYSSSTAVVADGSCGRPRWANPAAAFDGGIVNAPGKGDYTALSYCVTCEYIQQ